jgi:hypothetical protein
MLAGRSERCAIRARCSLSACSHSLLADGGHRHPGPLRHDGGERLVLDGLDERGGGPGVADLAQPDEPVRAVQQVGVPLIGAEDLDEQRLPVRGGRDERPRALRLDPSRLDAGHRQARRAQRRRDPLGADAPVGHSEQDQHAGPGRYPGGERNNRFHRRGCPGDQPHHGGKPQRDPGSAPPRAAEPRRGGDRDGHGGSQKRGARQRRAGKPRPLAGAGRQIAGPLSAGELDDPDHHRARQDGGTGQAGQQPEPAVTQRYDHCGGGRGDEGNLYHSRQHPARQGGRR